MAKPHFQDASLPSGFIILVFLQLLSMPTPGNGKADFDIIVPDDPILAIVGKDTELPCQLSLNISAEDMELRWYRNQSSPAVYLYKNGTEVYEEQMVEYRGRTTFMRDHITQGKAAVRIHNVTVFDNGTYHCHFKDDRAHTKATLWLNVAGLGSQPVIIWRDDKDDSMQVECTSTGWCPQPQVEWKDFRGNIIPSVTNLSVSATSGLFSVVSSVVVKDRAMKGLSCSITNPLLLQKKVTESHQPASFSKRFWSMVWRIVLSLILTALGIVAAVVSFVLCKQQKEKNRKLLDEVRENKEKENHLQARIDTGELINVSPSLDPDTTSSKLLLSEDLKSVSRLFFKKDLPDNPERFDKDPCVLGKEQFTSGRYYWEVEVGNRRAWNLGVCLENVGRKGRIPKSPKHGLWAVELYKKKLWALTFPRTRLHPSEPLHRVGIFLDCEAGNISFYNGVDGSRIYMFSGVSFSGSLRPFFCLWVHDPSPLTICSVPRETEQVSGSPQASELPQETSVTPVRERAASFSRESELPWTRFMFLSPQSNSTF
ncbi:butyrophilin-like protein 10 [Orycteropus afer afer]|uniref:Butyrophilin-like protein 10 n=1 Tax=Orycteropus afer afer TaxID=1230840 RepID=A0A8B7AYI0_ORYAF|nr:butyrophilin-like protein 10 [Orycteropus afer afer]